MKAIPSALLDICLILSGCFGLFVDKNTHEISFSIKSKVIDRDNVIKFRGKLQQLLTLSSSH